MLNMKSVPLAASIILASSAFALAQSVEVTASALNLRTGPSSRNSVIATVRRGTRLTRTGSSGNWTRVSYNGRSAYAYSRYLRNVSSGSTNGGSTSTSVTRYVTASSLNVRSGPSTRYRSRGGLRYGQAVAVTGTTGDWARINYRGSVSYVHTTYLSSTRPGGNTGSGNTGSGSTGNSGNTGGYASSSRRSRAGFIQLASSGPGFYGYYSSSKRWGRSALVYGIERAARRFKAANPGAPRIGVGDLSLENGGDIVGHASHERGVDADVRPMRNDGSENRVEYRQRAYSRPLTQQVITLLRSEMRVKLIFFLDSRVRGVQPWPKHNRHFHVRIR